MHHLHSVYIYIYIRVYSVPSVLVTFSLELKHFIELLFYYNARHVMINFGSKGDPRIQFS